MSSVFVVDDSIVSLKTLTKVVESEGFSVTPCQDSYKALESIKLSSPDIVLLDIIMPGMSGLELLKILQKDPKTIHIPIIMVTSRTDAADVKESLELGAFDYVKKPYEPLEIIARIRSALRVAEYQERLLYHSTHDSLTGLLNHGAILAVLERSLMEAEAHSQPLSIVMVDLDHFKNVNDEYGHQAGDKVLKEAGRLLALSLGGGNSAGRYGGEEFCIVLERYDGEMARKYAEAFRRLLGESSWDFKDQRLSVTASLGVAAYSGQGIVSSEDILRLADNALYTAKEAGRNTVILAANKAGA